MKKGIRRVVMSGIMAILLATVTVASAVESNSAEDPLVDPFLEQMSNESEQMYDFEEIRCVDNADVTDETVDKREKVELLQELLTQL